MFFAQKTLLGDVFLVWDVLLRVFPIVFCFFLYSYVFFMFQKVFFMFWMSETSCGEAAWGVGGCLLLHGQKTTLKAMFLLFSGVFSPFVNKELDLLECFILGELFLLSS